MAEIKRFTKIFTIADYEEEKKWLENQHAKGWRLIKIMMPFFYTFEKTEPENVIYQLEYKEADITDDYLKMYEDYGWEFLAHIWVGITSEKKLVQQPMKMTEKYFPMLNRKSI